MGLRRARVDRRSIDPAGAILDDERSRRLYESVQALDEAERVVVVLHYFQGLSLREVVAGWGIPAAGRDDQVADEPGGCSPAPRAAGGGL